MITIREILNCATRTLTNAQISSARLDAGVILRFILNEPQEFIFLNPDFKLDKRQENKFLRLIRQRATHYPVAYITGQKEFFGLNFRVNKNVIIPRPETELIVEEALKLIEAKRITAAEIGTGSGCIAIALTKNTPQADYIATDISGKALTVAKINAKILGVQNIKFKKGNLLEPITQKIDLLIANLPYLDAKWRNLLKSSDSAALEFEPKMALNGGGDGLHVYKKLIRGIAARIQKPNHILLEIGAKQGAKMKKFIKQNLINSRIEIIKDLSGFDRVVKITLQP